MKIPFVAKSESRMSKKNSKKSEAPELDEGGRSPMWYAAMEGDVKVLKHHLSAGVDPNVGDHERLTPLYIAAYYGRVEAVEMLLLQGANPNLVDVNGLPPLHVATFGKHNHVVKLLVRAGADPDHKNKWGVSPRAIAQTIGNQEAMAAFDSVVPRQENAPGPGKRAPTPREAAGTVDQTYYWTIHARLWDELVPPDGQATTVQGEIIRIVGKLTREAYTNGNMNWSPATTALWRFVAQTLDDPETFTNEERTQIKEWVKEIIRDRDNPDVSGEGSPYYLVVEKAVAWAIAHPAPIPHPPDPRIKT